VSAERRDGCIEVTVRDRGRWRLPRGDHRGRGLKIMHAAMDDVKLRAGEAGTVVSMRRKLGP
jgi:anti-sigma regulatory factor (Ser/Thr protein kinase)